MCIDDGGFTNNRFGRRVVFWVSLAENFSFENKFPICTCNTTIYLSFLVSQIKNSNRTERKHTTLTRTLHFLSCSHRESSANCFFVKINAIRKRNPRWNEWNGFFFKLKINFVLKHYSSRTASVLLLLLLLLLLLVLIYFVRWIRWIGLPFSSLMHGNNNEKLLVTRFFFFAPSSSQCVYYSFSLSVWLYLSLVSCNQQLYFIF